MRPPRSSRSTLIASLPAGAVVAVVLLLVAALGLLVAALRGG